MLIEDAVERAVIECIRQEREGAWEDGKQESQRTAAINLAKMGMSVEKIAQAIEIDMSTVEQWLSDAK